MAKKDLKDQLKDWADEQGRKHAIDKPLKGQEVHQKLKVALDKDRKAAKGF